MGKDLYTARRLERIASYNSSLLGKDILNFNPTWKVLAAESQVKCPPDKVVARESGRGKKITKVNTGKQGG